MLKNKRGAALLQVLLVTVVLAGMATMLLRASLSRTTAARQTRRSVSADLLIGSCQAEIHALWALKSPEAFARDMSACIMQCNDSNNESGDCTNKKKDHICYVGDYRVTAEFDGSTGDDGKKCKLTYKIEDTTRL